MEIINTSYKGSGENYQSYSSQDTKLITSNYITPVFGATQDYVEYFIYDLNNQILNVNYNCITYAPINVDPKTKLYTSLGIDPEADVKSRGFNRGSVNIQYNFLKNLFNSSPNAQYWIKEISPSRKELKLSSQFLSNLDIQNGFNVFQTYISSKNYYSDFYLNFGNNDLVIAVNAAISEEGNDTFLLIKLYEPLPFDFDVKSTAWLVDKLSESVSYNVDIQITAESTVVFQNLRGPNFSVNVNQKIGQTTPYYNYTGLFSSTVSSSMQKLRSWYDDKAVSINVDYTNFSNFIHFSSATERVKNFAYKLQLIENYNQQIQAQNSVYGFGQVAQITQTSIVSLQNSVNAIIEKLDPYEYYLYFSSESFAWPKINNTQPYSLYSVTSSQATNWLGSEQTVPTNTTASILFSASYYDSTNSDLLSNTIPQYLLDDANNEPYVTFVNMVGQHFDNIWLYYKDVSNRYNATNNPNTGISKDLVADALRSFGTHIYTNTNLSDNLYYTLFGINEDGSLLPPTGSEIINNYGNNLGYVTSSIPTISANDVQKEIYKRLYHNLPYLLKTKGTSRSIKALISCFGIPDSVLTVNEFGGGNRYQSVGLDGYQNQKITLFTSSLLEVSASGLLRPDTTIQYYANDTRKNSIDVEVGFSPTDQVNAHITGTLGNLVIDNYIGVPDMQFSSSYDQLEFVKRNYFNTYYNRRYNVWDYIRLVKYFNNSVFKMVKDCVPARVDISTGVIIKSHILERSKYARHEPDLDIEITYSQSIDLLSVTGSDALQIKFDTTKSGYRSSSLGLIPYTSSTGVEKYTGEFAGSVIRMKHGKNPFDQTEVSQIKNYSQINLNNPNTVYYVTASLGALYQNVTESQRSKRFFDLDYTYDKNVPVNFGIVTQSMSRSLVNNYETYTNKNSPYAFVQDYNYYTNAFTVPRYYGSKTQSSLFTYYVQGESGSYGNTAAVDKIKYEYAYLVDIYSSSILMPRRCNAQIKYIIDNNQNVLDLTKANTNIFYTQNIFKSGETVNVSLFDYDQKNPDVRYLTNNSGLGLYEGGFIYFPLLHNLSGSAVSFSFNLPQPIAVTQTIPGGNPINTTPSIPASDPQGNLLNYSISPINYANTFTRSSDNKTFTHNISLVYNDGAGGTISMPNGVTVTITINLNSTVGISSFNFIDSSGNLAPYSVNRTSGFIQLQMNIDHLLAVSHGYKLSYTFSSPVTGNPGILDNGSDSAISVVAIGTTTPGSNPQQIVSYTSALTDPQTCLYYLTGSQQLVFSNTIATYYGKYDFTFDSNSDLAYTSSLFQAVNTPFSINVGDQIHFYTASLGWSEKEEYVFASAYISGGGSFARLYAKLNRPLNLNLLSQGSIDAATNSNLKACRYIVLKHVPDETNLILRYNPATNILQDGLVFPQYIDQTVKDQSGNTIKSLKSQNLI